MRSIRSIYKVGFGPSSSHTVGPYRAANTFKKRYPDADKYEVTLFGSLAFTGAGHGTGRAITSVIPDAELIFDTKTKERDLPHPNTMLFKAFKEGNEIGRLKIMSVGGGNLKIEGEEMPELKDVYKEKNFDDFIKSCGEEGMTLAQYVYSKEDNEIRDYLQFIWESMEECVERGLNKSGILPGGLEIERKAKRLYNMRCYNEDSDITMDRLIAAFSYAVCEENASEDLVVTAPTCGSCGVIPAIMYYMKHEKGYPDDEIVDALATAAVIGNVITTNASISGAECGCQAEIGSACSMAAAALASLYKMNLGQIEYAAEVAMEHHLGLTCDPVKGLVQIPCIERNAVAAMRAINAVNISRFMYQTRKISFDTVVDTMYKTGLDLNEKYRETSHGGLATLYKEK